MLGKRKSDERAVQSRDKPLIKFDSYKYIFMYHKIAYKSTYTQNGSLSLVDQARDKTQLTANPMGGPLMRNDSKKEL